MRHSLRSTFISATLLPLVFSACHCGETLDVIQASPQGSLSTTPVFVEVQFDRPLLDPDSPGAEVPSLDIHTRPELGGTVNFPTPSSLAYSFATAPAPATEVSVTIDAGLRSFDGAAVLKSDYSFSFVTERNRMERITVLGPAREDENDKRLRLPERGDNKLANLDLGEQLLVHLRFPATIEQLEKLVAVRATPMAEGEARPVEFTLHFPDESSGLGVNRFLIRPKSNWPKHAYLDVEMGTGLKVALDGAGPVGSDETQALRVATYGPIDITAGPDCELCTPPNVLAFEFTTPVTCTDVVDRVSLKPKVDRLSCAGQPKSNVVRIEPFPKLASFTEYTLTVDRGVRDAFGQELAVKKTFTMKTGSGSPRFAHQLMFNVLERKQGGSHEEKVYKAAKLKVRGKRLKLKEAWSVIRSQGLEDQIAWERLPWWLSDPYYYSYYAGDCYWDDELGEEVCGETSMRYPGHADGDVELSDPKVSEIPIDASDEDEGWSVVQVPLDPYLEGEGGIVVLEHTPYDEEGNKLSNPVLRLLNVTDVGLTARYSPNQMILMAARLSDGSPVAGAEVAVYAAAANQLDLDASPATATTNAEGVAVFRASELSADGEVPDLQGQPLFVTAQAGDDQAFLWSRFTSGGRRASTDGPNLVGAVYTERGVYRPGEKVYYRAVVRNQTASGFTTPTGSAQVSAERSSGGYYDSDEDEAIYTNTQDLSEYGTVHGEFVVPASARIGDYGLTVKVGDKTVRGSFMVAEFRRAEMKVVVNTDASEYVRGDKMNVRVNADYLFGAPAAGLDVRWTLRRSWAYFNSKRFQNAVFSNSDRHYWYDDSSSYTEFLDEGRSTLDDKGSFTFSRRLAGTSARGRVENLVVSATVDDESGQSVSSRRTVLVHPAEVHVGIVPKGYIKDVGRVFSFDVVSVTPDDQPAAGVTVKVGSRQERWYSVKRQGPGGRMYWDWRKEVLENDEVCTGRTDENGVLKCQFTPKKGGSLRLVASATDRKKRKVVASAWYWVVGDPNYYGGRSNENRVSVFTEKPEFEAGETARVALSSPFKKALAMITVEREDILWHKVMEVGTNATVDIPIASSWTPNVYISATLVRGRVTPEGGLEPDPERDKPAYAMGYVNIKVKPTHNVLDVKLSTDREKYEPGEQVSASVITALYDGKGVPAEVNLYAVDEGVLMLTGYRVPNLIPKLFAERPYGVLALDTRMHVLGRREYITPVVKGEDDGGGGGEGDSGEELRKDFNPVATWVGAIETDGSGKAIHRFKVPDTLTTYRLMAVAVTKDDRFGSGKAEFLVNKTLMMRQALSRFARPGDRLQGGVVVNQLSGADSEVEVTLEKIDEQLFTVRGERTFTRTVGANETVPFRFDIEANDAEGEAEIIFAAKMGKFRDRVQLKLPVKRLQPREAVSVAGVLAPGTTKHRLTLPPVARAVGFDFNASGLPVANLEDKIRGLVGYPYGCLEQRTSKIMPLVAIQRLSEELNFASIPTDKIGGWVNEWVSLVPKYRCSDDGFDYYPGCASGSDPYLTAFALEGMLTVRQFGYEVPDALITPAADYLEQQLKTMKPNATSWDRNASGLAGALRVLTALGRAKPALENRLYEGRTQLPLFAKTDLIRAIHGRTKKLTPEIRTLLAEVESKGRARNGTIRFAADDPDRYWWAWDSDMRSTALVLRTLLQVQPADDKIPLILRGLVALDNETVYYATQGITQTLIALAEAAKSLKDEKNQPKMTVTLDRASLAQNQGVGRAMEKLTLPGSDLRGGGPFELNVTNSGEGPLYYGAFFSYAYPATARLPARDDGFAITRRYTDREGRPIGKSVKVGDYVMVELEILVEEDGNMVVVDDPLPAGLEPVDTTLETSDTEMAKVMENAGGGRDWSWWRSRYKELRDDRTVWSFRKLWRTNPRYPLKLRYLTRATTAGTYYAPGTRVERMYQPFIRGRGVGADLTVLPK